MAAKGRGIDACLPSLLHDMADLGDAIGKAVVLTPENCREVPVFRYDAARRQMAWVP